MSEKLENKKIKEGEAYLGLPPVQPSSSRPAQPAGGPARLLLCRLRPRQREGSVPSARARHRATPPASLLAWRPPRRPGTPERRHAPPYPLTLPRFFLSSPSLSLSRVRTRRSPPFAIAAATGLPSPPRHAQELRPLALKLSVKPQDAGRPVEPPSPSSSSSGSDHHRRRFAVSSASPSPLRRPLQPR